MKKFKIGDKIKHKYFGKGVVEEIYAEGSILIIKLQNNPPDKYNGGQNPCLVFRVDCKKVEE